MRSAIFSLAFVFVFVSPAMPNSECVSSAKVVPPLLSPQAEKTYVANLENARGNLAQAPDSADAIIWVGRRTAYLGRYKDAIEIYSKGIERFPLDARMYRHRGHRLISIRCLEDAIRDLSRAAELVKGEPDEIEPDGLPNSRNIPTSTLQSNIWYHLGLAYYLKGDFEKALKAYRECLKVSKNPDMFVATQNWHYLTLRRLGKVKDAEKVLESVEDGLDIIENDSYYKLLKLYQGKINADSLLKGTGDTDDLQNTTMAYGIGNWLQINGEIEKAKNVFEKIVAGDQWSAFGYIAAEAELMRVR